MAVIKSLPATKTLSNQLKYLEKEGKTKEELKEGINCNPNNIETEFNTIKLLHGKPEGKQYYHFTQAFSPEDNITPEKANKLGKEWIENNIKDHQVYMVTHIDKNHIHNHFVINSVNMEDGKKLQVSPKKLFEMKKDSNKICEREGLKKIDVNKKAAIKKTMAEIGIESRGITTWKDELRQCIDFAKDRTKNLDQLKELLKKEFEIETRETKNSISFKHPEQNKAVRGKNLGNKYTKEELENGFIGQEKTIGATGNTDREPTRNIPNAPIIDWGAVEHNARSEEDRLPKQFGDEVIGTIQQQVRAVEERTNRAIGIRKQQDRKLERQQRDIKKPSKTRNNDFER